MKFISAVFIALSIYSTSYSQEIFPYLPNNPALNTFVIGSGVVLGAMTTVISYDEAKINTALLFQKLTGYAYNESQITDLGKMVFSCSARIDQWLHALGGASIGALTATAALMVCKGIQLQL